MGPSTWPELGPYADPIEEHASKLKEDINGFSSFNAYNRDPMPTNTYRVLMRSLSALCDKILHQPTPTQLYESVENVRILIQGIQTTTAKTHDSVQEIQKTATSINSTADRISTATKTYASAAASRPSRLLSSFDSPH
jgi:methyl-accepting chemotaxis protein